MTREEGGKLVRDTWVKYVLETCDDPKPSHIVPWGDMLSEWDKEADRRIYDAILAAHAKRMADLVNELAELQQQDDWHRG
jgi:hypothetical protein